MATPLTMRQALVRQRTIAQAVRASGIMPSSTPYDAEAYRMALVNLVANVPGYVSKPERDLPTWQEEANASRFPYLNRRGNKAGRYVIKSGATPDDLSAAEYEQWQDRLTQMRQYAKLAGISINGKDYSKAVTVRAGKHASAKGAEFDVTHTSRWDGGRYDHAAAQRAAAKREIMYTRAAYPWLVKDDHGLRSPRVDKDGNVYFGRNGDGVTVAALMLAHRAKQCKEDCATDATARAIRQAATIRSGSTELDALIREQSDDMRAQRKGRMLKVTMADLTA